MITVPLLLIAGDNDRTVDYKNRGARDFRHAPARIGTC